MKNQYVGDIGDYGKYGLLRFLAGQGIKIGVNWYLTENDGSSDGRFTSYLKNSEEAIYDPELFNVLKEIAFRSDKTVKMIEDAHIIPNAEFYKEILKSSTLGLIIQHSCWEMQNSYLQILTMVSPTGRQQEQKTVKSLFFRKMYVRITTAGKMLFSTVIRAEESRKPGSR